MVGVQVGGVVLGGDAAQQRGERAAVVGVPGGQEGADHAFAGLFRWPVQQLFDDTGRLDREREHGGVR
ncbi:hypothetical protein [Actinosynnema sp. NPDC023587]|uniref:hypothetical protein n=1 Tax=Actinosynnema sp. NPDC023587 TaxID=3154695 RepID=UPI0033C57D56